jgi:hypothetical protein
MYNYCACVFIRDDMPLQSTICRASSSSNVVASVYCLYVYVVYVVDHYYCCFARTFIVPRHGQRPCTCVPPRVRSISIPACFFVRTH